MGKMQNRSQAEIAEIAAEIRKANDNVPLYINENEAATITGLEVASLRKRRWQGVPPLFFKFGRAVRYEYFHLHEWMAGCACTSTSEHKR